MFELMYVTAFFLGAAFAYVTVFVNPRIPPGHRLNPMKFSLFLASWGGAGIILQKWLEWPFWAHLPAGIVLGLLLSMAAYRLMPKRNG